MRRIATNTKAVDLFGAGKHGFKDGDLSQGIAPTDLNAEMFNDVQEELAAVVEATGTALSGATRSQVAVAIQSGRLCAATGAGTADAIIAVFSPAIAALKDGMILFVRAASANATTTPTFSPANGTIAAKVVVKGANAPLVAGDIAGAGHWIELQYDQTLDRWILQNPATGVTGLMAGEVAFFARSTAPTGYIKANGAAISRAAYSALFAAIGTTFGAGDGATTFNLPDLRGEFLRGFDDGRGVDTGRTLGSFQAQSLQSHNHSIPTINVINTAAFSTNDLGGDGIVSADNSGAGISFNTSNRYFTELSGAAETRPRNVAMLACIKY